MGTLPGEQLIGEHLGRAVRLLVVDSFAGLPGGLELRGSAVALIHYGDHRDQWRMVLDQLFAAAPVAIAFWGSESRNMLDTALDVQSVRNDHYHVMTYLLSSGTPEEAMWEFLHVVFPVPERLGEWSDYSIVVVSAEREISERLQAALQAGYSLAADRRFQPPQ